MNTMSAWLQKARNEFDIHMVLPACVVLNVLAMVFYAIFNPSVFG